MRKLPNKLVKDFELMKNACRKKYPSRRLLDIGLPVTVMFAQNTTS